MKKWTMMLFLAGSISLGAVGVVTASEASVPQSIEEIEAIFEEASEAGSTIQGFSGTEAQSYGYDTAVLTEDGVEVKVSDQYGVVLDSDGYYYVYKEVEGSIPYVMFGAYEYTDGAFFGKAFTPMMQKSYSDLSIAEAEKTVSVGTYDMQKIVYHYTVSGYEVYDTRLAVQIDDHVIMFGSKEIPSLNKTVDNLLYEVASGLSDGRVILGGGGKDTIPESVPDSIPESTPDSTPKDSGSAKPTPLPGGSSASRQKSEDSGIQPEGYITFSEDKAGFEGAWVDHEEGFKYYIPNGWTRIALDPKSPMTSTNVRYMYKNEKDDASTDYTNISIVLMGYEMKENESFLTYIQSLVQDGWNGMGIINMNGINVVTFESLSGGYRAYSFISPADPMLRIELFAYPYGNETQKVSDMISAIMCSLTPTM